MSNNQNSVLKSVSNTEEAAPVLSATQRKVRKLKQNPRLFLADSKAYVGAKKTVLMTRAKIGSFALVILASLLVVIYYSMIASPRYVSQVQFVVKQSSGNSLAMAGLLGFGGSSTSTRDALILQEYIQSQEMAVALDEALALKTHYQQPEWDRLSRLSADSSTEDYVKYYQDHVTVKYDEMSEILLVEVQSFDAQYSLQVAQQLLTISENLINSLGEKMALQQTRYAQDEVQRAHQVLQAEQLKLIAFQDDNSLYNPEAQGTALFTAITNIEALLIEKKTELKSLLAYLRPETAEVKSLGYEIQALEEQLLEEKGRLTNSDQQSLNKVNVDFKEIELSVVFAGDLYKSALASLEMTRAEAFKNLKHLLVVVQPRLAEQERYPERGYSIFTWFVVILLIYLVGRLVLSVIKEHQE